MVVYLAAQAMLHSVAEDIEDHRVQIHHVRPVAKLDPGGETVLDRGIAAALQPTHHRPKMVGVEEDVDVTVHASLRTVTSTAHPPLI